MMCKVGVCDNTLTRHDWGGLCNKHRKRFTLYGDPLVTRHTPVGSDQVAYRSRHWRVSQLRGKAEEHTCVCCGSAAQQWAQVHDSDGLDEMDYMPLCVSCHREYDKPSRARGEQVGSAKLTYDLAEELRELYETKLYSIRGFATMFGITYRPAWNIINGKAWVRDAM